MWKHLNTDFFRNFSDDYEKQTTKYKSENMFQELIFGHLSL